MLRLTLLMQHGFSQLIRVMCLKVSPLSRSKRHECTNCLVFTTIRSYVFLTVMFVSPPPIGFFFKFLKTNHRVAMQITWIKIYVVMLLVGFFSCERYNKI